MTNKELKRTLLFNVVALVLSISMFVGSTFAWFTDTATTGVNTINSGTLKINLQSSDGTNWVDVSDKPLAFVDADENALWEPGVTYKLPKLRIEQKGTLAFKYSVLINAQTVTNNLADVIMVSYDGQEVGLLADLLAEAKPLATGNVVATTTELKDIEFHMLESAGNDYQGAKIEGISLIVLATQYTYEKDSTNDQYDATAEYEVVKPVVYNTVATLNLANKTYNASGFDGVINAVAGADLTIEGNGNVNAIEIEEYAMAVWATGGAKVTIKDGYYTQDVTSEDESGFDLVYASGKDTTIVIEGGTFKAHIPKWTLNLKDNSGAQIIVKGGEFFEYDPSHSETENPVVSFVADGYKVVTEERADGTWYIVVPATA